MATTRAYYSACIPEFLHSSAELILGKLTDKSQFDVTQSQRDAWQAEIAILQRVLVGREGAIYFEYSIPRLGKRIDVLLLIGPVIFVIEFKVGEHEFTSLGMEQVWDYGLDLKNFHETSSDHFVAPILVATEAHAELPSVVLTPQRDKTLFPMSCGAELIGSVIDDVLAFATGDSIDPEQWERGRYCPTPTIIEAAMALYNRHSVSEITRNDATAVNLSVTSQAVDSIIRTSKENSQKAICFVTGVPGAGKTLVGLNVATTHFDKSNELYSVFLSGNGPLVAILREALARDKVRREKECGRKCSKAEASSQVQLFIQSVHHFRDDCLVDARKPPIEHVAIFDEAQRAWNLAQTSSFMSRKRKLPNFGQSEPEFLISCMDRHLDWAVIVCLVGGGQEIHTGEAGIGEWMESLNRSFPDWRIYVSPRLSDSEYAAAQVLKSTETRSNVVFKEELHLAVSMRSFRAENVSMLVKQILDLDQEGARTTLKAVKEKYPIAITRDPFRAKKWLRDHARGSERYGLMVSSHAERLKPHAIHVKAPMNPVHWFLDDREDVRSSFYLEDVATEFAVQGLELDWSCVVWDADFRRTPRGWGHWSFRGDRWNRIQKEDRQFYQRNAYRVLLTRARQGMVIVVPDGDSTDPTRKPEYYDSTYQYLTELGMDQI
jgi:hypothetical protein